MIEKTSSNRSNVSSQLWTLSSYPSIRATTSWQLLGKCRLASCRNSPLGIGDAGSGGVGDSTATMRAVEEQALVRIPLAVATVRLMRKIPSARGGGGEFVLRQRLPAIVLRIDHLLASRLQSIRAAARQSLVRIVQTLGTARHWLVIIAQLRTVLLRGYQRHVLVFTAAELLRALQPSMRSGDMDRRAVAQVVELCGEELFGQLAEERQVEAMRAHTSEAKRARSFESVPIAARYLEAPPDSDAAASGDTMADFLLSKLYALVFGEAQSSTTTGLPFEVGDSPSATGKPSGLLTERKSCLLLATVPTSVAVAPSILALASLSRRVSRRASAEKNNSL